MSRPSKRICRRWRRTAASATAAGSIFPHPVSPTNPSVSPRSISRSTPSTACTAPTCFWKMIPRVIGKCFTIPSSRRIGSPDLGASSAGTVSTVVMSSSGSPRPGCADSPCNVQMTSRGVAAVDRQQVRLDETTFVEHVRTARRERAAIGEEVNEGSAPLIGVRRWVVPEAWDRAKEPPGIRHHAACSRCRRRSPPRPPAGVHHLDLVRVSATTPRSCVINDHRRAEFGLQVGRAVPGSAPAR